MPACCGRPGEPESLNRDLRELLYSAAAPAARLRNFLARRHAGGQTALQLLCAVFPQDWPLITPTGTRALEILPAQRRAALAAARIRFDFRPRRNSPNPASDCPTATRFCACFPML